MNIIETERLFVRTWKKQDSDPYFQMNQDAKVIEFLRGPLTLEQVKDFIAGSNKQFEKRGYTLWAVELKATGEFIGFVGLNYTDWPAHFTPAVEIGWRLGSRYWGKGYAREAAMAVLNFGFEHCGLKEIVSFTVPANVRSIRVMESIGMKRDLSGDFAHPKLAPDHPLSLHVLYRISKPIDPNNSLVINDSLVQRLVATQFPQWKNLPIQPVALSGWDNRTFHLGNDMLVRMPSQAVYALQVEKEQHWLPILAPHLPLQIPVPLAMGMPTNDYPWHWSIYRWLEGESAASAPIANLNDFAMSLAHLLIALQSIDVAGGPLPGLHSFYRGGLLKIYDEETRKAINTLNGKIDTNTALVVWETALASTWQGEPVWVHGDIAVGNLLVKEGHLTAVIDFGQLAVGDPACDLAIAWTLFEGESRKLFRNELALDDNTWARARGWTLWKCLIVAAGMTEWKGVDAFHVIAEVLGDQKMVHSEYKNMRPDQINQVLSSINSFDEFEKLKLEIQALEMLARMIVHKHNLPEMPLTLFPEGTNIVFQYGNNKVIKIFPSLHLDQFKSELLVLKHLQGKLSIHTPFIEFHGDVCGWPYIIMTKVEGTLLEEIWGDLEQDNKIIIMSELGTLIREVHALPTDGLEEIDCNWNQFIQQQINHCTEQHRFKGLSKALLEQIPTYIEPIKESLMIHAKPVLLTGEYTPMNFLVKKVDGLWHIDGLIDFGDCMLGLPEYDLLGPGAFLIQGNKALLKAFLISYGYSTDQLTARLRHQLTSLMLLHKYSNLNVQLRIENWNHKVNNIKELENLVWGL